MPSQGERRYGQHTTPGDILRTLAALAPKTRRPESFDVSDSGAPLLWLGTTQSTLAHSDFIASSERYTVVTTAATPEARRLAAVDALHAEERLLREGWVFLCGPARIGDREVRLCTPLVSHPIRLRKTFLGFTLLPAGDTEVTTLVDNAILAATLESQAQYGGGALFDQTNASDALIHRLTNLHEWIERVAGAAGLRVSRVLGPSHDPLKMRDGRDLVAVVGTGIYATRDVNAVDVSSALTSWAGQKGLGASAFGRLYGVGGPAGEAAAPASADDVRSPLPLSDVQRSVVASARTEPITVVSGPPGCGKSHTLVATAIDAVARGASVLVATQSSYAAEVLGSLLDRYPGPTPVLFGNAEHRAALASRLEQALQSTDASQRLRRLEAEAEVALAEVTTLEAQALELAQREQLAHDVGRWDALVAPYSARYPGLFQPSAEPRRWAHALDSLRDTSLSAWRRWRTRRQFRKLTGLREPGPELTLAIQAALARRAAVELDTSGGTVLAPTFDALARADQRLRDAVGAVLAARAVDRTTSSRNRRSAVAALSGALRSGRSRRRELLRRLDAGALVEALPLWVGTLSDIEHLLPAVAGLFDLVLLDEASQIDQRSAPPALLRARRAVIAGDPRQLRHVSFVGDEAVTTAIDQQGSSDVAHLLDVRRMSAYDVATGAAAVHWLGDHYRSVPHLIEFSSRRFYDERVALLTRKPGPDSADVIDVVRAAGVRDADGINAVEIEHVAAQIDRLADQGATSIGIVTPFRAQADAIEQMVLGRYDLEAIQALGLRVGTVHAFQGNERDWVIVSTGVDRNSPAASLRFVEDVNLFNVMITRARRHMTVVTSAAEEPRGILGTYLAYADRGPQPPVDGAVSQPWVNEVCSELRRCGFQPRRGYPVGRWNVDAVVPVTGGPVALDCFVDEGGPADHLERHRQLRSMGWRFVDAYPSRFGGDAARAALLLTAELRELGDDA